MRATLTITGRHLVAGDEFAAVGDAFGGVDPRTGTAHAVIYGEPPHALVDRAVTLAADARFEDHGPLLDAVATELETYQEQIIETADAETGLGVERLTGELARTTGQLRAFADMVASGGHREAVIDHGRSDPALPDMRRYDVPVGPVAVFPASNFPLAFGVPGNDTAAALAAGCPVVVKAHPAHPMTAELCGRAILRAAARVGAPAGWFSLVHGRTADAGLTLVRSPRLAAVAFTGGPAGGRALMDAAAARPEPIPVYAEMGAINPLFVSERAAESRGPAIATDLAAAITTGSGQFCTKPGLIVLPDVPSGRDLLRTLAGILAAAESSVMVGTRTKDALTARLTEVNATPGIRAEVAGHPEPGAWQAPGLYVADSTDVLLSRPGVLEECFGPVALAVLTHPDNMAGLAARLPGSLAAAVHAEPSDRRWATELVRSLTRRAGRIVFNGYPPGARICHATVHTGPHPAASSPSHTSVGLAAVRRFLRPVCYQDFPDELLPPALHEANTLGLTRLVDGEWVPCEG